MMMRKRRRGQERSSDKIKKDETDDDDKGSRLRVFRHCFDARKRSQKTVLLLTSLVVVTLTTYALIRGYYALELWLDDPFLEAQLITPLTYLRVRFFATRPLGRPRRFVMQRNNTFVMNLDSDVDRFQTFQKVNNVDTDADNGSELFFQRFSAFRWIISSPGDGSKSLRGKEKGRDRSSTATDSEQDRILSIQKDAMYRYPILRYSVQQGRPGNAGCTMSHIQLLQQLVGQKEDDGDDRYYFIFEDDATLSEQLLQNRLVEGPPDADIVILSPTSTKTVRIPYPHGNDGYAVRVVQSYGAFAYVITKNGANKLLRHFRGDHDDPIDVAFHQAQGVRMYHPTNGWPQAYHSDVKSTRHAANKGYQKIE